MTDLARALAHELQTLGLPVFAADRGATTSHQFAIEAAPFGGGQAASKTLRKAGFLACGIGLPIPEVPGLIVEGLRSNAPETVAPRTKALRARFQGLHYVNA